MGIGLTQQTFFSDYLSARNRFAAGREQISAVFLD